MILKTNDKRRTRKNTPAEIIRSIATKHAKKYRCGDTLEVCQILIEIADAMEKTNAAR